MADLSFWPDFRAAFNALYAYSHRLQRDMAQWDGALWLPHSFKDPEHARAHIAAEAVRLYHLDDDEVSSAPASGLWLITEEQASAIAELNTLKDTFKTFALKVRGKDNAFNFTKEMERDPEFSGHLGVAGMARLDFKAAYRTLRVIDEKILKIRWIFSKHQSVDRFRVGDIRKKLIEDGKKQSLRTLEHLAHLPDTHFVVERNKSTERLVANVNFLIDGEVKRKAIPCSGMVYYLNDELPRDIGWNDTKVEERTENKTARSRAPDPNICAEPIFDGSQLHLYKVQPVVTDE